jgi:hypothetical protein
METKALKSAVKEFNKVIELSEPVNVKSESLEKDLYEALEFIEDGDKFSKETEAVFAELRAKYDKPKKEKKPEKVMTVKAGDSVEMDPDDDEVKVEKKSKKEKEVKKEKMAEKPVEKPKKEKGEAPEVKIIRTILDRKVGKDVLTELIKTEDVFDKKTKKALLAESNFMSLKKKMLDVFDEELVKKLRAELPPISHEKKAETKSKPAPENPIVNSIKSATKVKQLKKIAKANDQFNWKKLRKLEDFEDIQDAMLKSFGQGKTEKKAEPKVVMVPNPLIAEINAFEKRKKLYKWAEDHDAFEKLFEDDDDDELEDMDIDELKEALIEAIPAKIESKGKSKGASKPRNEAVAQERREFLIPLLKAGEHTRTELKKMLDEKFGADDPHGAHPHNNMLSECQNEKYYKKHNLGKLVEITKKGKMRFVK